MATYLSSDDFAPFRQNVQPAPTRVYSLESSGPARVLRVQLPPPAPPTDREDSDRGDDTEHWPVLLVYDIKQQVGLTDQTRDNRKGT